MEAMLDLKSKIAIIKIQPEDTVNLIIIGVAVVAISFLYRRNNNW